MLQLHLLLHRLVWCMSRNVSVCVRQIIVAALLILWWSDCQSVSDLYSVKTRTTFWLLSIVNHFHMDQRVRVKFGSNMDLIQLTHYVPLTHICVKLLNARKAHWRIFVSKAKVRALTIRLAPANGQSLCAFLCKPSRPLSTSRLHLQLPWPLSCRENKRQTLCKAAELLPPWTDTWKTDGMLVRG